MQQVHTDLLSFGIIEGRIKFYPTYVPNLSGSVIMEDQVL